MLLAALLYQARRRFARLRGTCSSVILLPNL
jgi:hypothetical protein